MRQPNQLWIVICNWIHAPSRAGPAHGAAAVRRTLRADTSRGVEGRRFI